MSCGVPQVRLRLTIHEHLPEPVRLNYQSGGLLTSRTQGGSTTVFEYNARGQARAMRRDGEEFRIDDEKVCEGVESYLKRGWSATVLLQVTGGWVTTNVLRNGARYVTFTSRTSELALEGESAVLTF